MALLGSQGIVVKYTAAIFFCTVHGYNNSLRPYYKEINDVIRLDEKAFQRQIRVRSRKFRKRGPKNCGESATSLHTHNAVTSIKRRRVTKEKKYKEKRGGEGRGRGPPLNPSMQVLSKN